MEFGSSDVAVGYKRTGIQIHIFRTKYPMNERSHDLKVSLKLAKDHAAGIQGVSDDS